MRGRGRGRGGGGLNRRGFMRGGGTPAAAHFPEVLVAAFAVIPPPAPKSVFSTGVVPRAKRKRNPGSEFSVAQYLEHFEKSKPPARKQSDSSAKARRRKLHSDMVMVQTEKWLARDKFDPKCTADARNTLFVSRLNYKTTEDELRRHMQEYGSIKDLKLVCTLDGKPRGYAFVEMETNADFARAHRGANMTILNGARICVDVERGRTMKDWKPRRLGGGGRSWTEAKKTQERKPYNPCAKALGSPPGFPTLGGGGVSRQEFLHQVLPIFLRYS